MKILVINGSPKKEKSDTMHITHAFLDGMKEVGFYEIRKCRIEAYRKDRGYIKGCV